MGDKSETKPLFKDECNGHCICTRNTTKLQFCVGFSVQLHDTDRKHAALG